MKILFPRAYLFRKIVSFNLALHRSKLQFAPPTENIHGIWDGCANSETGYYCGAIDVKMNGSIPSEKSFLNLSKLDWGSHIASIVKILQGNWSLDLFYGVFFVRLSYLVWCSLAAGIYMIDYRRGYVGLLVLHLLSLVNIWLIVGM